jgi:aspartyl aminopeptidase
MSGPVSVAGVHDDLRAFLDGAPSPYHAVAGAALRLEAAGFTRVDEAEDWRDALGSGGGRHYTDHGGALIAFTLPDRSASSPAPEWRIVGAHTDSPCLRIKPVPDLVAHGWRQIGVEVYGGILANSWLDRDLGVAGRLALRGGEHIDVDVRSPLCRIPQLAVHLDRDVNERGLQLDRQTHLVPVWGDARSRGDGIVDHVACTVGLSGADVVAHDLRLYDITPSALLGGDASLFASGRLDNLVSCWAAVTAITAERPEAAGTPPVCTAIALFDHEEVGSESTTGAAGPLLERVLERVALARGATRDEVLSSYSRSICISADNAHAVHPNYPERHEPQHRPVVNAGPALKSNANQRYATDPASARFFIEACERADVPWQHFVSRNNMPCGSTIGPITATRLGISTVDVGVPQLSMHSARELCGADDPFHLARALTAAFAS